MVLLCNQYGSLWVGKQVDSIGVIMNRVPNFTMKQQRVANGNDFWCQCVNPSFKGFHVAIQEPVQDQEGGTSTLYHTFYIYLGGYLDLRHAISTHRLTTVNSSHYFLLSYKNSCRPKYNEEIASRHSTRRDIHWCKH